MNEKCNKCWSLNGEDFFDDWDQLIDELWDYDSDNLPIGAEYFEADKVETKVKDYVSMSAIENLLEQFDDWVYGDVGEVADCDFYNATQDAKKELQELIQVWAEKHVNLPYWNVHNVVKKVVMKEDLE